MRHRIRFRATARRTKLLVSADKNPNSNGARLTGISPAQMASNLPKIADGIRNGSIKTLIVFGEDVTKHGISADLLGQLELLIVSDILPNKTTALAHFLLPGCAPRGKARHVHERQGPRVHRKFIQSTVEPPRRGAGPSGSSCTNWF